MHKSHVKMQNQSVWFILEYEYAQHTKKIWFAQWNVEVNCIKEVCEAFVHQTSKFRIDHQGHHVGIFIFRK
jgi:hypothetical protein